MEASMMKSFIAATSLFVLAVAFLAPQAARAFGLTDDPVIAVVSSSGKVRHVVRNANDCAPSRPVAVWGWGKQTEGPIGYRCVDITNGG
jgi:hypothetical protein